MSTSPSQEKRRFWSRVSEDWWGVILGLILLSLVYFQVLAKVPW